MNGSIHAERMVILMNHDYAHCLDYNEKCPQTILLGCGHLRFITRWYQPDGLSSCHAVDSLHVVGMKHLQTAAGDGVVAAAFAHHLLDLIVGDVAAYQFTDVRGHADGVVEALHGFDTLQGGALGVGEVVGHIHHVHGEAYKPAQVLVQHVAGPTGPDGSQAGAMGDIEHGTRLCLYCISLVAGIGYSRCREETNCAEMVCAVGSHRTLQQFS